MSRKQCFDQKCINCIKSIVKQQLSECMDISMCINNDMVINGDLTVNGNVYYETIDISNTYIDNLHLGTMYLDDGITMGIDPGTNGQVLVSRGGLPNQWINANELNIGPTGNSGHVYLNTNVISNSSHVISYGTIITTTTGNTGTINYGHNYASHSSYSLQLSLQDPTNNNVTIYSKNSSSCVYHIQSHTVPHQIDWLTIGI